MDRSRAAGGGPVNEPRDEPRDEPAPVLQWIGVFLPAAAFFGHLQINYLVVPWACVTRQGVWVHITGIASVVVAVLGTVAARRAWVRAGDADPGQGHGPMPRTRFLGAVGVGMGATFVLVLLAQTVATFVIETCQ